MNYEYVMSPIQIGSMYLKNRVSFTPVWPSFATADGHVNRELMEWVRDIVKGGAKFNQIALMDMLKNKNIDMIGGVKLVAEGENIVFEDLQGEKIAIPYDNLILSLGVRPNQEKIEAFSNMNAEVIFIGDCNTRIGTLFNAIHTGHEAAYVL